MHYVQVNIGRNIGSVPMPLEAWDVFQHEVTHELARLAAVTDDALGVKFSISDRYSRVEYHVGEGHWGGNGQPDEDSVHLSILIDTSVLTSPEFSSAMADFTRRLRELAENYHQEAIALITGSRLIKPRKRQVTCSCSDPEHSMITGQHGHGCELYSE